MGRKCEILWGYVGTTHHFLFLLNRVVLDSVRSAKGHPPPISISRSRPNKGRPSPSSHLPVLFSEGDASVFVRRGRLGFFSLFVYLRPHYPFPFPSLPPSAPSRAVSNSRSSPPSILVMCTYLYLVVAESGRTGRWRGR